ncbi:MAG: RecX family transcriptional regulator [Patescibacteria group bacterium]
MPTITSIKSQKKKNRVNIYLDDKFGFGIDLENFVKLGLKVDQEVTETEIEKIVKKAEFQKTLDKLLRFATLRPRSEKEISLWLRRKKVHESLFNKLFDRLNHLELINDEKFAKWWVEQRQAFRPKPKRILNNELRMKGISSETIKKVLGEETIDEEKMARELLDKKMYKWKNLNGFELRQKMSQYLAQKGFSWEIIEKVVKLRL